MRACAPDGAAKWAGQSVLGGTEAFANEGLHVRTEGHVPSDVRFAIVRRRFESRGWSLDRIRGSHHIFSKPGRGSFPVPVHKGKVKAAYVKAIEKLLDQDPE